MHSGLPDSRPLSLGRISAADPSFSDQTMSMWDHGFRLPDGVEVVGMDAAGNPIMRVAMPGDDDGYLGRQCPFCSRMFRIFMEDYRALPEGAELWCVYCGHHVRHTEFLTEQQLGRAMRAVGDVGVQAVGKAIDDAFSDFPRSSRSGGVSISFRSTPFHPEPLPEIDEERLIRERVCSACHVRYAVFSEHRYCPVCGALAPSTVALDALQAEAAKLDAFATLPAAQAAVLREQGVVDRALADTIKNLATIVEALASAVFHDTVTGADQLLRGKGNVFQRLDDAADLFTAHGLVDFRVVAGVAVWRRLLETWAARHLLIHRDGLVDQRYLTAVPSSPLTVGTRLTVTEQMCRQALADTTTLCRAIAP